MTLKEFLHSRAQTYSIGKLITLEDALVALEWMETLRDIDECGQFNDSIGKHFAQEKLAALKQKHGIKE